jgi:hypothetical protein
MILVSQGFESRIDGPQRIRKDSGNGINNRDQVDEKDENPEKNENVLPLDFHNFSLLPVMSTF